MRVTPFTDHRPPEASPETLRRFAREFWRGRALRLLMVISIAVFVIVSGGTAIAPWLFSADALSRSAAGQLQSSSGLYVVARGPARLVLTPRPHILIRDVAFADLNGALLIETPELNCALNIGRLLAGRVQVTMLTLTKPRAIIDSDKGAIVAPGAAMRASLTRSQTPEAQQADAARLGVVNIIDGALTIKRRSGDQIFERMTISLDWPRIGQPALIAGGADWRGERHEAMLWIARPGLLLRNDQSFVALRLDGKNLSFEADGFAAIGDLPHFSGRLAGRAAAAREALQLFDVNPHAPGPLRDAQFSAEAIVDGNEARLDQLRLRVDGNALAGTAALRSTTGGVELSAALSGDFVSLEPILADLPAMLTSDGQWSHEPLDLPEPSVIDVDLRIDAGHARLGRLNVSQGSFSVQAHQGVLDLALLGAKAYGGKITAQARIKPQRTGAIEIQGSARAEKVDASGLLWDALGQRIVGGALDADIRIDAKGADADGLMRSLTGQANLALANGDIEGVDFPRALKLLATNPLASAHAARTGRSRISMANSTINFANGVGVVATGLGRGDNYELSLSGDVNIAERALSLKTVAFETKPNQGSADATSPRIVFDLKGGWDDPSWRPDPQSFTLRSGAAATLLPQSETSAPPAR